MRHRILYRMYIHNFDYTILELNRGKYYNKTYKVLLDKDCTTVYNNWCKNNKDIQTIGFSHMRSFRNFDEMEDFYYSLPVAMRQKTEITRRLWGEKDGYEKILKYPVSNN